MGRQPSLGQTGDRAPDDEQGAATVQEMERPMRRQRIPQTDSIRELAEFWDTHDVTDFDDELEEVTEPVSSI